MRDQEVERGGDEDFRTVGCFHGARRNAALVQSGPCGKVGLTEIEAESVAEVREGDGGDRVLRVHQAERRVDLLAGDCVNGLEVPFAGRLLLPAEADAAVREPEL